MKDSPAPLFEGIQVFRDLTPRAGADQMALDEAILESADCPVLRVYCWSESAVSFGYSQSYGMVAGMFSDRPSVRRWTGGGVVEHGSDWTFSLMVPARESAARLRPAETYERIHAAVMSAFSGEGTSTRLAGCDDRSSGAACFVSPALHDVLAADGKKLCGGAQRRTRHGFLHQGSVQGVTLPSDFADVLAHRLALEKKGYRLAEGVAERAGILALQKYGSTEWRLKIP